MKYIREAAVVLAMGVAAAALGQTTHTESTTKHTGAGPNTKSKMETVTGMVKSYDAGKKIVVTGPNDKDYSFDLDDAVTTDPGVAVGQKATVKYTKDTAGNKAVSISGVKGGAMGSMDHSAHAASAAAPTMHSESTTKHTGPGPNTKVKTETVIGTVKTYEAGKKITVTGPKSKDYSFDLDETVTMSGSAVNAGDRVKVTYTKGDNGEKAVSIAPYTAKKVKVKKAA
ncbi:MAG: hypothetical protein ABI592_02985 [Acidobacteriota bacterium]